MDDSTIDQLRSYLRALGLDDEVDPHIKDTPRRVTELLHQLFSGLREDPPRPSTFEVPPDERPGPVVICALPFQSMCAHHLLPFFGAIDVAYQPAKVMVGFGSIGRIVDHFARRPQVQERMIAQIADHIDETLEPDGLLIRLRARQLCMEMRGSKKSGELVSLAARGTLRKGRRRTELLNQFQSAQQPL